MTVLHSNGYPPDVHGIDPPPLGQVEVQERWSSFYRQAANNESVRFLLGAAFFAVFYFGVIVNIKKRRKDYEDRVKLQQVREAPNDRNGN